MSEPLWCPFSLTVDPVTRFLNGEFVDHPVYDGFELQWFDDDSHGRGMLAFLSRREDRRVDYYVEPGLQLDRGGYEIGGGTGRWVETSFGTPRLDVDRGGVHAEVAFLDVDGRTIEIRVDDREAGPRRGADLLAPVGAGIQNPASLLLVYLHGFDLVRRAGEIPLSASMGRHDLWTAEPGRSGGARTRRTRPRPPSRPWAHGRARRCLGVLTAGTGVPPTRGSGPRRAEDRGVAGDHRPGDDHGGTWRAVRRAGRVDLGLEVTRPWRPAPGLPPLMRTVTRLLPTFRRWPTSYRWRAEVVLDDPPRIESRWERTGTDLGERYRLATRS